MIGPMFSAGDRHTVGVMLLAVLALAAAPFFLCERPEADVPLLPPHSAQTAAEADREKTVTLLQKDGQVTTLSMADYLWGVVAAEMPASFHPEALKAQACAARTYAVGAKGDKHPQAQVCSDSRCCQAYLPKEEAMARWGDHAQEYSDKIQQAVAETDGLGILYEGKPIQALFFSSAAGQTADAVEVWGNEVSYLQSVPSPEGDEVPNYHSSLTLTPDKVRALVLDACPGADLSGDPAGWFGQPVRTASGLVERQSVGGVPLTGGQLRKLFSLRSASFTLAYENGQFCFSVTGHGHGVGMSQYGADIMARQGKSFREILTWYYTGVEIGPVW